MMTSNVFGHSAARNVGYAEVELQQTLAEGHPECRIVVYLGSTPEAGAAEGREYLAESDCRRGHSCLASYAVLGFCMRDASGPAR
jgi:hypothetical protein